MGSRLKDKWILITGASSGFGAAAAHAFGAEGARLLLGARRVQRLEQVADEARTAGAQQVHIHALDVSMTASVQEFVSWAKNKLNDKSSARDQDPKLDVLVNNAGGAHGLDPVAEGKDEDWETMFQTN